MPLVEHILSEQIYQAAGILGFGLYVCAYTLLTCQFLSPKRVSYFVLNLAAASLVMFSLLGAFNLATLLIQMFWIIISIFAIQARLRARRQARRQGDTSFNGVRAATLGQITRA